MNLRLLGFLGGVLVALAAVPGAAGAQDGAAQPLPLRQVVLFSSGVGYFERAGRVEGRRRWTSPSAPTR